MTRHLLFLLVVFCAVLVAEGFNNQQQYCPYGRWPTGYCYSDWDCYYGSYCYRGYGYGYGSGICCPSQKRGPY